MCMWHVQNSVGHQASNSQVQVAPHVPVHMHGHILSGHCHTELHVGEHSFVH